MTGRFPHKSFRPSGMLREASPERSEGRARNPQCGRPASRVGRVATCARQGPRDSHLHLAAALPAQVQVSARRASE